MVSDGWMFIIVKLNQIFGFIKLFGYYCQMCQIGWWIIAMMCSPTPTGWSVHSQWLCLGRSENIFLIREMCVQPEFCHGGVENHYQIYIWAKFGIWLYSKKAILAIISGHIWLDMVHPKSGQTEFDLKCYQQMLCQHTNSKDIATGKSGMV